MGPSLPSVTLPQIKMEAHGGPLKRMVVLKGAPLRFHVNLEECSANSAGNFGSRMMALFGP